LRTASHQRDPAESPAPASDPASAATPAAAPKGLARRVRELVGDDGHEIAQFMYDTMTDEKVRRADRLQAAAWLADRGFGKAELAINIDLNRYPIVDITQASNEDLDTLIAIAQRSGTNPAEIVANGGYRIVPHDAG
jgi:hypothetical protein